MARNGGLDIRIGWIYGLIWAGRLRRCATGIGKIPGNQVWCSGHPETKRERPPLPHVGTANFFSSILAATVVTVTRKR